MSLYCYINTLDDVEHSKCQGDTKLHLMFPSLLFSYSKFPMVFISQHRDMYMHFIFLKRARYLSTKGGSSKPGTKQILKNDDLQKCLKKEDSF